MDSYTGFANVYDQLMDNIEYDKWTDYIVKLFNENGLRDGIVLELGCGTGNITARLSDKGYDMIGVDNSYEMLQIAMEKKNDRDILYLLQDMREIEMYGTVAGVVSVCDSINYLVDYKDLVTTFSLVNKYLDPDGVFVFDLKTSAFFEKIGDGQISEVRDDCSFIWDNYFDKERKINSYDLTIFEKTLSGLYERSDETHTQRAYSIEEIKKALDEAGMIFEKAYIAFSDNEADDELIDKKGIDRVYIVARENGKRERIEKGLL